MNNIIAAVDIGTTKICAMIGRVYGDNRIQIIGESLVYCKAIRKYSFTDTEQVIKSIRKAVTQAQKKANLTVNSVYVNIRGIYLNYIRNEVESVYESDEKGIQKSDIAQLIKKASKIQVFEDEKIVDIVPVKYILNGEAEVNEPLGLHANKLSVDAEIAIGHAGFVKSLCQCVQKAGYVVDGVLPESACISSVLLHPDERKGKSLLIDVGGTITEFVVSENNCTELNTCIPIGGEHITSDVSQVFSITAAEAETIKKDIGTACVSSLEEDREVVIYHINKGETEVIMASNIVEVMEARIYEIFELIRDKLSDADIAISDLDSIVISGEGIRLLNGMDKIVENVLGKLPRKTDFFVDAGYLPAYTVAYSMISYVASYLNLGRSPSMATVEEKETGGQKLKAEQNEKLNKIVTSIKEFFSIN